MLPRRRPSPPVPPAPAAVEPSPRRSPCRSPSQSTPSAASCRRPSRHRSPPFRLERTADGRIVDVGRSVDEIAADVITRMREAEQATLRHLEAMELEATRRYELVTAQAELDAS